AYTDVVHEKTARFFRTSAAAAAAIEESRSQDEVVAVTGPTPTGPWRGQWGRRFPAGYRIDIEERRRGPGHRSRGGEHPHPSTPTAPPGMPHGAQPKTPLARHNVTLAEWLVMESMERGWFRDSAAHLCRAVAESGSRLLGVAISEDQCRNGLEACLRYGWLRV